MDILAEIEKRCEELDKDYQNVMMAINRIDNDRANLVNRGLAIRGSFDELQRLKAQIKASEPSEDNSENSDEAQASEEKAEQE